MINGSILNFQNEKVNEKAETNLLEADVHVEGEGFPRVTHRRYTELPVR